MTTTRTPEQIAELARLAANRATTANMNNAPIPAFGPRGLREELDRFAFHCALDAATLALEAQTPPDFKPEREYDEFREQWNIVNSTLVVDGDPVVSHFVRIDARDEYGTQGTRWLTITPDQARRILAMLSTEGGEE